MAASPEFIQQGLAIELTKQLAQKAGQCGQTGSERGISC